MRIDCLLLPAPLVLAAVKIPDVPEGITSEYNIIESVISCPVFFSQISYVLLVVLPI